MNKRKIGFILIGVTLFLFIVIVGFMKNKNNFQFQYKYLDSIKLNNEVNSPVSEFEAIYYYAYSGEIFHTDMVCEPVILIISSDTDKEYFEEIYKINIEYKVDFDTNYIIVACGSKIRGGEILGIYKDELSEYNQKRYNVELDYEDEYDANILYFYEVDRSKWKFVD